MQTYAQTDIFGGETPIKTKTAANTEMKSVKYYGVELIKEKSKQLEFGTVTSVRSPDDIYKALENIFNLSSKPQEHLVMLAFDTKNNIIGAFTVHIGSINSSIAAPRDILQRALLCNATSYAVAHNHPSGNPHPSPEDIQFTKRLDKASEILGIQLLDHVIIGDEGRYYSLKQERDF